MDKILMIHTGGTIESTICGKTIDVSGQDRFRLLHNALLKSPYPFTFESITPLQCLSENLEPQDWSTLLTLFSSLNLNHYKGIIITHGSDTLPYTAAALSYGLKNISLPVCLVCAAHPLEHPQSNGFANLAGALDFIYMLGLPGVFVPYQNTHEPLKIHLGTRLREADFVNDAFESFGKHPLAHFDQGKFVFDDKKAAAHLQETAAHKKNCIIDPPDFKHPILAVKSYPGLDYRYFNVQINPPKAILHVLYHSGTANVRKNSMTSLATFIKSTSDIDHYLISYKDLTQAQYATAHSLFSVGGLPLCNIGFEATLTKLWFAYNQEKTLPKLYMQTPCTEEFLF